MTEGPTAPRWTRIFRDAIEARLAELHTGLPAKVLSFNAQENTCSVKPLLVRVVLNDDDEQVEEEIPVISRVPVHYATGGGWYIAFPLVPDDIVFLAFAERALDTWKAAVSGQIVDPKYVRKHDLSDAIAIPGIRPRTKPLPAPNANLIVGREDGTVRLELRDDGTVIIKAAKIELGEGAPKAVARVGDMVRIPAGTFIIQVTPGPPAAGVLNPTFVDVPIVEGSGTVTAQD